MRIELYLPGSIRSKKNSKRIFARGKMKTVLPSKAYMEWEAEARYEIARQLYGYPDFEILPCPVHINAQIYYKGKQPDLSGCLESIGDCLEGLIFSDDRQIVSWDGSRLYHDKSNPRTNISVWW